MLDAETKRDTRAETYETLMDDTMANLIVTDPPYNVNYEGSAGKIKNDNMASEKFYQFLLDAFTCMEQALAEDGSLYFSWEQYFETEAVCVDAGYDNSEVYDAMLRRGIRTYIPKKRKPNNGDYFREE